MGEGGVESEAAGQGRDFPRSLNGKINRAIRCDHKSQEGVNKKKKKGWWTDRQTDVHSESQSDVHSSIAERTTT